ncbi:MAG: ATP synthase F1 subunit epsilon [Tissierellia bacterium]|nr:ATP synthase F1 subunit epsilon [Tissierellia bacterium]
MIRLIIVTPEREVCNQDVDRVIVRGSEGDLAFMESTAPLVTPLRIGHIHAFDLEGNKMSGANSQGYVTMKDNVATVLTDTFEWDHEIDRQRAEKAKERAEAHLRGKAQGKKKVDKERASIALAKAISRLELKKDNPNL